MPKEITENKKSSEQGWIDKNYLFFWGGERRYWYPFRNIFHFQKYCSLCPPSPCSYFLFLQLIFITFFGKPIFTVQEVHYRSLWYIFAVLFHLSHPGAFGYLRIFSCYFLFPSVIRCFWRFHCFWHLFWCLTVSHTSPGIFGNFGGFLFCTLHYVTLTSLVFWRFYVMFLPSPRSWRFGWFSVWFFHSVPFAALVL